MIAADKQTFLRIHPNDNVLVALQELGAGESISFSGYKFRLQTKVAAKHKFTICDLEAGAGVYMFGVLVGKTMYALPAGSLLSTQNLKHAAGDFTHRQGAYVWQAPDVSKWVNRTFDGYHRADGHVGTRNYWLVVPVFCENRNVETMKDAFLKELGYTSSNKYQAQVRELASLYRAGKDLRTYQIEEACPYFKRSSLP